MDRLQKRWTKINGAQVIHPRPARQTVKHLKLVTAAIASGVVSDGPTRTFRATYDLVREATVVIFGDDLDTGAAAAYVTDRERSAIR